MIVTLELLPQMTLLSGSLVLPFASTKHIFILLLLLLLRILLQFQFVHNHFVEKMMRLVFIGPCIILIVQETCWARKKWNKIASDIKLVVHSSKWCTLIGYIQVPFSPTNSGAKLHPEHVQFRIIFLKPLLRKAPGRKPHDDLYHFCSTTKSLHQEPSLVHPPYVSFVLYVFLCFSNDPLILFPLPHLISFFYFFILQQDPSAAWPGLPKG